MTEHKIPMLGYYYLVSCILHIHVLHIFDEFSCKTHLLGQKTMLPEDQAKAIVFLASDDASRITGALLDVDAGFHLASPAYDFSGSQAIPGLEKAT